VLLPEGSPESLLLAFATSMVTNSDTGKGPQESDTSVGNQVTPAEWMDGKYSPTVMTRIDAMTDCDALQTDFDKQRRNDEPHRLRHRHSTAPLVSKGIVCLHCRATGSGPPRVLRQGQSGAGFLLDHWSTSATRRRCSDGAGPPS
jgi:hypothetical protein